MKKGEIDPVIALIVAVILLIVVLAFVFYGEGKLPSLAKSILGLSSEALPGYLTLYWVCGCTEPIPVYGPNPVALVASRYW